VIITKQIEVPDLMATSGNRTIEVYTDMSGDSDPRDWDCLGTIVGWDRDVQLGKKQIKEQYQVELVLLDILDDAMYLSYEQYYNVMEYATAEVLMNAIKKHTKAVVLPIYVYNHSGISVSTSSYRYRMFDSAGWDWGISGIIYATESKIKEEYGGDKVTDEMRTKAIEVLKEEIKTLDMYYKNEVYWYTVKEGGEEVDSCGGIYARGLEDLKKEIKSMVNDDFKSLVESLDYCSY
jgi:hypothetical protein